MVSLTSLRNKIDRRIFTLAMASSATLSSLVSPSQNKWGDETASYSAGTTIDAIPFSYISDRLAYQPFGGASQEGEVDFVIKYTVTVNPGDRFTWQGDTYFITEIDKSAFLGNGLVVQVIRCRRTA